MQNRSSNKLWHVTIVSLSSLAIWCSSAHADTMLEFSYTATVTNVYDTYGVFGSVVPGNVFTGVIRYSTPPPPPVNTGNAYSYDFTVTASGNNLMSAQIGAMNFQATQHLYVDVYQPSEFITGGGTVWQFNDGDISVLNASQLPNGYRLANLTSLLGLFPTDPFYSTYPDLPTSLAPFEKYDNPDGTAAFFTVDIFNPSGGYVDSPSIYLALTSLTAVPEPSAWLLTGSGVLLMTSWTQCKRLNRLKRISGKVHV